MKSIIIALVVLSVRSAFAWGPIGHRVVGKIAELHLNSKTALKVKEILGDETLASVANWADFIKSDPNWKKANSWHYVSIPDGKSYEKIEKSKDGDVVWAIEKFSKVLSDKKATKENKAEAIKFLVHFVGDVHQPLHVGHVHDRGGNDVKINWFKEETNLHAVWDESLIDMQKLSYTEIVEFINHPTKEEIKKWQEQDIKDWLKESIALRDSVYDIVKNKDQYKKYGEYLYNYKNIENLNHRMLQAGVRLAGVIEKNLK